MTMPPSLPALTPKEKEALRLLASGHDAKSIARHLGLSVHTIHERLRDARRKLGVSSSREAARLLREWEAATPQSLGDRNLGAALPTGPAHPAPHQSSGRSPWPRWPFGAVAMSVTLAMLALAIVAAPSDTPPAAAIERAELAAPRTPGEEQVHVTAARQFLALVDARDWEGSWQATGQAFKALNSSARWAEVAARVQLPLGAVSSRSLVSAEFVPAPPAGIWLVKFRTAYANKPAALETLSLAQDDGAWRVVGITVE